MSGDPYYANVSLLLPMSGENNGTTFTDLSPSPKTLTRYGDTKTVTAQSKWYGSSAYFDGNGDYLQTAANSGFEFGTGDFTIEFWLYYSGTPAASNNGLLSYSTNWNTNGGWYIDFHSASLLVGNGVSNIGIINFAKAPNSWNHIAITRAGSEVRAFNNGIATGSATFAGVIGAANPTNGFNIGRLNWASAQFSGYLQDLRITKGAARYTANFTPPSRLLGVVSGIVTDRSGNPCQRKVYAVSRPTDTTAPQVIAHGLSDATTGAYELTIPSGEEVTRVVVSEDEDPLLNDLVDRVIPE